MQDKLDNDKRVIAPEDEEQPKEEECLDEALYDTFPASDPATSPQKTSPPAYRRQRKLIAREMDKSKRD